MDGNGAWSPMLERRNLFRQWSEKEWWFSCCYDHGRRLYLSWAFVRSMYSDYFSIFALDMKSGAQRTLHKSLVLDRVLQNGRCCLEKQSRNFRVRFCDDGHARQFALSAGEWEVDLTIKGSPAPPFIKRENQFERHYQVVHTYKNPVAGTVSAGAMQYAVATDHSYLDHCFGNVPRRTGWHWLAVQNADQALTSLVNYGPHAQRYTQVLQNGQWLRLGQDVAFEHGRDRHRKPWRVTSPDLDLMVEILGHAVTTTRIPPLLPLLVNINHAEFVVKASGRVRINGAWQEQKDLIGVMEEHSGWW